MPIVTAVTSASSSVSRRSDAVASLAPCERATTTAPVNAHTRPVDRHRARQLAAHDATATGTIALQARCGATSDIGPSASAR